MNKLKVEYSCLYFHESQEQSLGTVGISSYTSNNSQIKFREFVKFVKISWRRTYGQLLHINDLITLYYVCTHNSVCILLIWLQ